MQSKELRQAILHAIDRDILVNALFAGRTSTADSFQSKTFGELYLATAGEKLYDPAKARALVKASGYRGEPIVWRIQAGYYTQELVVTQAVASMLKAAGLNVKIEVKENWTQVEAPGRDRMINNASFSAYYSAYYPDPVAQLWRRLKPRASGCRTATSPTRPSIGASASLAKSSRRASIPPSARPPGARC